MNKLLYRKLSQDIIYFFLAASLSITLIIWVIQAVNFLDIVSEDGHSLRVYFAYSILSLPKIFSKLLPFMFFFSINAQYFFLIFLSSSSLISDGQSDNDSSKFSVQAQKSRLGTSDLR